MFLRLFENLNPFIHVLSHIQVVLAAGEADILPSSHIGCQQVPRSILNLMQAERPSRDYGNTDMKASWSHAGTLFKAKMKLSVKDSLLVNKQADI